MTVIEYQLAQLNIGRMAAPLDSAQLADFVAGLDLSASRTPIVSRRTRHRGRRPQRPSSPRPAADSALTRAIRSWRRRRRRPP
jgi:hypothetical protein